MMTAILKKAAKVKKRYFLDEEFWETISKTQQFNEKDKIETKDCVYKSTGSKYSGHWIGGFRHGKGVMQWPDGARYEGEWQYGRA
jgi:hypothetical protein